MAFLVSIGFLIPFVIMIICYTLIYFKVRVTGNKSIQDAFGTETNKKLRQQIRKSELQMMRTVMVKML